jgi:hypothetical protein
MIEIDRHSRKQISILAVAGVLVVLTAFGLTAFGQSDQPPAGPRTRQAARQLDAAASTTPATLSKSRHSVLPSTMPSKSAEKFYRSVWGVENLEVRETSSGVLLRFSYRVTDANRARLLNDKKAIPYLIDQKTGAVLQVPTMPKVGMLRQSSDPVNGLSYWMVFSNKGNFVKPGSRVDVVIGNFRAQGLVVQ